jgi:flagellar motility protein MotE (MotC chaperone)
MDKKKIIIIASAGLLSFALSFAGAFFFLGGKAVETAQAHDANSISADGSMAAHSGTAGSKSELIIPQVGKRDGASEKQTKELVYDLRQKMDEYNEKLKSLDVEGKRLEVARSRLEQDIEKLETLRADLAGSINSLKSERDRLLKTRIEISDLEKKNLVTIAASYDKMDGVSAGKILANMSQAQNGSATDAVKILYYMGDRNKAKVLAALADTEPAMAAYFSQKLKTLTDVQ